MTDYNSIIEYIYKITNIEINEENKHKLIKYASLAIDYNKKVNITGAKNEESFFNDHIADSLYALNIF